jgi:hypothetical protein
MPATQTAKAVDARVLRLTSSTSKKGAGQSVTRVESNLHLAGERLIYLSIMRT